MKKIGDYAWQPNFDMYGEFILILKHFQLCLLYLSIFLDNKRHLYKGEIEKILVDKKEQMEKIPEDEKNLIKDTDFNEFDMKEVQTDNAKVFEEIKVDEQKLREFLSNGELTVCHVRCIIVGCKGAGKTTLLRRLENVTYEELIDITSTEMVDVQANSFEVLEDEETIQSKLLLF